MPSNINGIEDDEDNDHQGQPQPWKLISTEFQLRENRSRLENLVIRIRKEKIPVRAHDVIIKGSSKT